MVDDIKNIFEDQDAHKYRTTDNEATYFYAECEDEPDMFMNHLKVTVYEDKHNILTDRLEFIHFTRYHIPHPIMPPSRLCKISENWKTPSQKNSCKSSMVTVLIKLSFNDDFNSVCGLKAHI